MATRRRGMKSIPNALSQGKDVFPITPFRAQMRLTATGAANNEREVLDFDLQFEDNEVLDIWQVNYMFSVNMDDVDAFNEFALRTALFEDPDKIATTDLSLEATVEDDSSLIDIAGCDIVCDLATSGMALGFTGREIEHKLPQPYTVARNIAVIMQWDGTEAGVKVPECIVTVWARRRNASDVEFKNIIYRQRF